MQKPQQKEQKVEETIKSIIIPEVLTIKELADKMKKWLEKALKIYEER